MKQWPHTQTLNKLNGPKPNEWKKKSKKKN